MKTLFSAQMIRNNLSAHRLFGVATAALLYLVCLSGTVSVFFEELDRWEQNDIQEYHEFSPQLIAGAIQEYQQRLEHRPESIYLVLPTQDFPRTHITNGVDEWYLNQDGSFAQQPNVPWTEMIKTLHTNLHLPHTLGMTIVGLSGVFIIALIISGIIAHPTVFRDAFLLRKRKSYRQQQTDLHNRLSVWLLPFHLMIAITGAFIGLSAVVIGATATAFYDGDQKAAIEAVYGGDPAVTSAGETINYPAAFANLKQQVPDAEPIYLAVHHPGQPQQLLEIAARLPGRLTYSEMYRFDSRGTLINSQGLADGPAGRQIAYSTYRIHFGHFAGLPVKILYGLMGLSLTLVCVFGMNIWFARQGKRGVIAAAWQGWIWGIPIMMILCYPLSKLSTPLIPYFWIGLTLFTVASVIRHIKAGQPALR